MLKISFKSSRKPTHILNEAKFFFERQGLKPTLKQENRIRFENNRGHVSLEVTHQSEVTVETENFDQLVKEFADQVKG
jgi:hypothetical protein